MKLNTFYSLKYSSCLLFACCFGVASQVNAAVSITDSFFASGGSVDPGGMPPLVDEGGGFHSYTYSNLGTFSASGSDKLVLGFANKDYDGVSNLAGAPISSVTYNGETLVEASQHNSFRQRNSVFYLDNVTSDGVLKVTFNEANTTQGAWALALYALDGTAAGSGDVAEAVHPGTNIGAGGVTVAVTESSAFVLNLWSRNNGDLSLTGSPGWTEDLDSSFDVVQSSLNGNTNQLAVMFASTIVNAPGNYASTANGVGGSVPTATFTGIAFEAEVTAIPEPSSTALLGLGGLALIIRRRKG